MAALTEQITIHLAALDRLERHGYAFPDRRVKLLATAAREPLAERIAGMIQSAPVSRGELGHPYYAGWRSWRAAWARSSWRTCSAFATVSAYRPYDVSRSSTSSAL